jgi:integrase
MLRAALNKAVEWGELPTNPLANVKALKGADVKRVRFLSYKEEKRLMDALKKRETAMQEHKSSSANKFISIFRKEAYSDHLQPMVLVAMNTCLRFGELSRMCWSDISLTDAPMITVQAVNKTSIGFSPHSFSLHGCTSSRSQSRFTFIPLGK